MKNKRGKLIHYSIQGNKYNNLEYWLWENIYKCQFRLLIKQNKGCTTRNREVQFGIKLFELKVGKLDVLLSK